MLTVGSTVNNYRIEMIEVRTVFAVSSNPRCPSPYVVWDLDCDKDGVSTGRYFNNRNLALSRFYRIVYERECGI